ncbi:acyclic terpene utilization AtuA family protein [Bacillus solimangrovi]|uniref:Acyclic terpene utilisation N-terminal domain-containing protein n=1 Tax=Bacillus solimangrovi TaxID=1305675 RepID=A0A1E5LCL8_9BACI|nr:acyclic terpene utilization AtuA family protein [Bacillus solimangrovi]OEH91828.1 hypothetical protein BFG57_03570 [Bacillus solimangrovi]
MKSVRIGAAQGFYGDHIDSAVATAKLGNVDYLCFDCLAELTMAILTKDQQKDSKLGYTRDITSSMTALLPYVKEKGIKLLTNAGGINPIGAQQEVLRVAQQLGIHNLKVAVVTGDNLFDTFDRWVERGVSFDHWETGESISKVKERLLFANAYIGAQPIVRALREGADIVITGRTTDTAQFLAPLIYEFQWGENEWDKLASGVFMGHLMECSAQSIGGNFSGNWDEIEHMDRMSYPISQVYEDGGFIITKLDELGGLVNLDTIREQMLYEIHDPNAYVTPDVIVDLTKVQLEQIDVNKVKISGTKGKPKPEQLKVVMGYEDGYVGQAITGYSWPDAMNKAKKAEEIIRLQIKKKGLAYKEIQTDFIGYDALHGPLAHRADHHVNEIFLRMAVRTTTKKEAMTFPRLFPPLALNGPPSMGAFIGNIPPRQLIGMWASFIPRELVEEQISIHIQEV